MPKVKPHRTKPSLDMTPMVDLAFLLVTFFMLTTKFAPEDSVVVDTPSSISQIKLPDSDVLSIIVDKDKRPFFGSDGQQAKQQALLAMGKKYNVSFTPSEIKTFVLMPNFGVPMANLKQFLAMDSEDRNAIRQPGIPIDSTNNQLGDWILQSRVANPKAAIAIKGDNDADVPTIQRVIEVLQKQKINRFSLITDMENKPVVSR